MKKNIGRWWKLIQRGHRQGSYIVESAIVVPVFLIGMVVLSAIVLFYSCIEDANYILATELRKGGIEAVLLEEQPLIPLEAERRIRNNHPIVQSHRILDYGFRKSRNGFDELIYIKIELYMESRNPMGFLGNGRYDVALMTRAYVGLERKTNPMSEADFRNELEDGVFVFPQDGERYHAKNCTFVQAESKVVSLNQSVKNKYSPCKVCKSNKAAEGSSVYIFPNYGASYHLTGCGVLRRRCIEIEKDTAVERGYTPCKKCGGKGS